jgi:hypothetical protein
VLFTDANLLLSQFLFYESPSSPISVALGGGSRNGHRTSLVRPFSTIVCAKVSGAGFTDLETQAPEPSCLLAECAESPLAGHWTASFSAPLLQYCFSYCFGKSRPIPVSRNFGAWDCKVTPVGCACQERNTTGCIPSNDGLDAGKSTDFPHCGKSIMIGNSRERALNSCFGTLSHGSGWGCGEVDGVDVEMLSRPSGTKFLSLFDVSGIGSAGLFSMVPPERRLGLDIASHFR